MTTKISRKGGARTVMKRVFTNTLVLLTSTLGSIVSVGCDFDGFIGKIDHDDSGSEESDSGDLPPKTTYGEEDPGEDSDEAALPEEEGGSEEDSDGQGDGCISVMNEFAVVCTTCPGDDEPECLVASCGVFDRCLGCTDPLGRTATDCSIDYEVLPIASHGLGGGDTFHSCNTSWGYPGGSSGVCHYPGTDSCITSGGDDFICIDCTYPDGSGSGLCGSDEPRPIMQGRPSDLPEPGGCVTETDEDGALLCSTCTREDLSASKACRFPPALSCEPSPGDTLAEKCFTCALEDGGIAEFCDDASI